MKHKELIPFQGEKNELWKRHKQTQLHQTVGFRTDRRRSFEPGEYAAFNSAATKDRCGHAPDQGVSHSWTNRF
jgi:hypothetical protein